MEDLHKDVLYLIAAIATMLGGNVLSATKKWFQKGKIKREASIEHNIEIQASIEAFLFELREQTEADRAVLYQFHNGIVTTGFLHLCKFSCTNESVREGISREKDHLQNLKIEDFLFRLQLLCTNSLVVEDDVQNMSECGFKQIMLNKGVNSFAMHVVKNKWDQHVAILGIEWVGQEGKSISKSSAILDELAFWAHRIGSKLGGQ